MIRLLFFLLPFTAVGQQIPNFSVNQSIEMRKLVKLGDDSVRREYKADLAKLPAFRKETLDSLNNLNKYITALNSRCDSIVKAIKALPATDTTWKALIRSLQEADKFMDAVNQELTKQVNVIKAWMDKVKLINFQ